jgi:hypothetical protein
MAWRLGPPHQGDDLQLTRYDVRGWRATFYTSGMEQSVTTATASAWEHPAQTPRSRRSSEPLASTVYNFFEPTQTRSNVTCVVWQHRQA